MSEQSASYWVVSDSISMIGRSARHTVRNLDALITSVMLPVMLLLLFVYLFGGAINTDTGTDYVNYVVPGIILLCAGFGSAMTAVSVSKDMTSGIVDRFRSMSVASSALLTGHVVASVVRNLVSTVLVIGVAVIAGFRPTAGPLEWLAVFGLLTLFMLAISWLSAAIGLVTKSAEAANGATFVFMFLPYVSSAFVPIATMPHVLHGVARHQPVTPVIETVRGLLTGTPVGNSAWVAVAWCSGILLAALVASTWLFQRRTSR
jgi:ABC-2 type transport system permease protein